MPVLLGGLMLPAAAQTTGSVGIGTTAPDASALLELSTTNKGLLLPRLTQVQREAIQSPAAGLLIYQTDNTAGLYIYGGTSWSLLPNATQQQSADNLGNHTATTNLNLGAHKLAGNGGSLGLSIGSTGVVYTDSNLALADNDLYLRATPTFLDTNHGLGYYGPSKRWSAGTAQTATTSSLAVEGPVLYGYAGGVLGTNFSGTRTTALYWNNQGRVGIATTNPQSTFHVAGTAGTANVRLESLGGSGTRVVTADGSGNLSTTSTSSLADNLGDHTATTNLNLNTSHDLLLRGSTDTNHGLGFYGAGKTWTAGTAQSSTATALTVDGPVLYGYTGGVLGTNVAGNRTTALYWNSAGRVGVATTSPQTTFHVAGTGGTSNVRLESLGGSGARMVTTDNSGNLSTASIPTDAQVLGFGNGTLSISGGNSISLSSLSDNLGSHTATTAFNLQGNALTGSGSSISGVGLGVRADGGLNIGQNTTQNSIYLGYQAGQNNTGRRNLFVGYQAGASNSSGNSNQFVGYLAGASNTTGGLNVFSGEESGGSNDSGYFNVFTGVYSGVANTSGSGNVFVGYYSGSNNTRGVDNTAVGNGAGPTSGNLSNTLALGSNADVTTNNTIQLGDSHITSLRCQVDVTTTSDARFKYDVQADVPGLAFIRRLRPVTYRLDAAKQQQFTRTGVLPAGFTRDPQAPVHTGFLAQEVEQAAQALNYRFDGVHTPAGARDYYGLGYSQFVVPLVKAVQEQQQQIEAMQAQNAALQTQLRSRNAQADADHAALLTLQAQMAQLLNPAATTLSAQAQR
ncbi:tail fiber domain-containing protein [Hymenobacter oligotrophus]|uniref:tail fiber domain-containing protein n=1 Tax=Hymenobacter oligotrophus TaxID=2319843 RepID=UPI0013C2BA06|nr:tail fiber domain-containing protein [Hymenobacter oligotrophus]